MTVSVFFFFQGKKALYPVMNFVDDGSFAYSCHSLNVVTASFLHRGLSATLSIFNPIHKPPEGM